MLKRWRRWLGWLAGIGLVVGTFTALGWRAGFSALPEPVPGFELPAETIALTGTVPETNVWHYIRLAAEKNPQARNFTPGFQTAPPGAVMLRQGPRPINRRLPPPPGSSDAPAPRVEAGAEVARWREAALACPDWRPPLQLDRQEIWGFKFLRSATLQDARDAADKGNAAEALRQLVAAWHLQAAAGSSFEFPELFDERGDVEVAEDLVKPFQALAAQGAGLSVAELRELLRDLSTVTNRLGRPEDGFARVARRNAGTASVMWRADWQRVRRSIRMAGLLIRQDAGYMFVDVLERALGRRQGGSPNYHGAAHVLRPLDETTVALQASLAREADLERMFEASVGRTFEALQREALPAPGTAPWLPGEYRLRSLWRRAFDRPTVWRVTGLLPDPRQFLQSRQGWRAGLESCRLTLALRLFKETHGRWPDQLGELSPGILETVPLDPLTGRGFEYAREGDGWRLAAGGPRNLRSAEGGLMFRHEPKPGSPAGREKPEASQGR